MGKTVSELGPRDELVVFRFESRSRRGGLPRDVPTGPVGDRESPARPNYP
jgi:hypothetical protein